MKARWFWVVFVVLVLARFGLSFLLFNNDFYNFLAWVESLLKDGFRGFYERDFSPWAQANYPPLMNLLFWLFHKMTVWLFPGGQSYRLLAGFYKLPGILLETFVATWFIRKKIWWGLILLLNPAVWYNTVFWGQTEGLMTALVVLSLISLLNRKWWGIILFVLALQVKQSAVIFIPVIGLLVWKLFRWRQIVYACLAGLVIFLGLYVPFVGIDFGKSFYLYLSSTSGQEHQHQATVNAYNLWYALGYNKIPDNGLFWLGRVLFITIMTGILVWLVRKPLSEKVIYSVVGLISLMGFLVLTRMHERHLFPALVFLIPMATKSRSGLWAYGFLSFIHFVNLYQVWKEPVALSFLNFVDATVLSWLTLAILIIFALLFVRRNEAI